MNRRTDVAFPVFHDHCVRVILARDLVATGKRLQVDLSNASAAFVPNDPGERVFGWIILGPQVDEALIAHEASHAVRALFARMGARNEDEHFAYHLAYLVERIHRLLKRGKK